MNASVRRLILVATLSLLCVLTTWVIGRGLSPGAPFVPKHPGKFDRGEWLLLGKSERFLSERKPVLGDLVANYLPVGMRAFDVEQLLGPADRTSGVNEEVWHYNINGESTFDAMSEDNLELRFDSKRILETVKIVVK